MAKLFEAFQFRDLNVANRIMVSPMCQYSADAGKPTPWHLGHLGGIAIAGPGLLCLEATAVSPEGRITQGCLGLWDTETERALSSLVSELREIRQIPLCLQLSHAGRKGSRLRPWEGSGQLNLENGGWKTCAPSALPHYPGDAPPEELSTRQIDGLVEAFAQAAVRACRAGFEAIEIHAAHGYLLHAFLSPIANHRNDAYGGDFGKRIRFVTDVIRAVRSAIPSGVALGVRISATDWVPTGPSWVLAESIQLTRILRDLGVDWIDVSSGGVSKGQAIPVGPLYQVSFARSIRAATGMPTIAVGLITQAHEAEKILHDGAADMVAIGRAMLSDPRWPWRVADALGEHHLFPEQYSRALSPTVS